MKKKPTAKTNQIQKPKNKPVEFVLELDAAGMILGRLATQVANGLRGKGKPSFRPNIVCGDKIVVTNASKMKVTGNKLQDKTYYHHTGYLGHLKSESLGDIFKKNPGEVLKRAVSGMLPKNKLRKLWLKNLTIFNGEKNASKN